MAITAGNEHELSHQLPHPEVLDEDGLKKLHPEWFHATDYHWLDTSVKHDFWDNVFYKCDYDPIHGKYHMFAKS